MKYSVLHRNWMAVSVLFVMNLGLAIGALGQAVTMTVDPTIINEGFSGPGGEAVITVTLSGPSVDGTNVQLGLTGTADGSDYSITTTLIQVPPGQTSGTATVSTEDDIFEEPVEELIVDIVLVSGGFEDGEQQVIITILDDDSSLPVELVSFDAAANGSDLLLSWATASESGNAGFAIETSADGLLFEEIGWTPAVSLAGELNRYRQLVPASHSGTNYVRLKQIDQDGSFVYSDVKRVEVSIADGLELYSPYPNPTRDQSTLSFVSEVSAEVSLELYDAVGRHVSTLFAGRAEAGDLQIVPYATTQLVSGTYFVRLATAGGIRTKRLTIMR